MPIGLLIADDHELLREGLRAAFASSGIRIVGEASTPEQTLRLAGRPDVDVLLLDIGWRGGDGVSADDGFAVLRDVRASCSDLPILMYSVYTQREFIDRCRRLGASGYLIKGNDEHRLVAAVGAVYEGRRIWPESAPGADSGPRASSLDVAGRGHR